MPIAYLTSEYPGVSHTFIAREIAAMRQRGFEIATFSMRRPPVGHIVSDADRKEYEATCYIRPIGFMRLLGTHLRALLTRPVSYFGTLRRAWKRRTPGRSGILKWLAYFAQSIIAARAFQRRGITHVHNHFANASANVAMLAAEFLHIPWSFTLHGLIELEWEGVGKLSDKVASAKFVVCICDYNRAQAMRLTHWQFWDKIHVVRCGLELSRIPYRPRPADSERPLRILSVARLSPEKDILGLLAALAKVRQEGINAELAIVGDGPQRAEVEARIRSLGLEGSVKLLGARFGQDVIEEYYAADIMVLASMMEGLPVVLMEAMAAGTPVVAPIVAGIPELFVHEQNGLLFIPSRWDLLAERIKRYALDSDLRSAVAERARRAVEEMHDIHSAIAPLADLLQDQYPTSRESPEARSERTRMLTRRPSAS